MGTINVRNLDDELLARLERRAVRHGRSAEAEARDILRSALIDAADVGFDDLAAAQRRLSAGRTHTSADVLLREGRDER